MAVAVFLVLVISCIKTGTQMRGVSRMVRRTLPTTDGLPQINPWAGKLKPPFDRAASAIYRAPVLITIQSLLLLGGVTHVPTWLAMSGAIVSVTVVAAMYASYFTAVITDVSNPNVTVQMRWATKLMDPLLAVATIAFSVIFCFGALYLTIETVCPGSFHSDIGRFGVIETMYFSLVTFATVGFGEIYPATRGAEIAVATEIVFAVGVLTFLVVSLLARQDPPANDADGSAQQLGD